jgi:hypothetical protein
MKKFVFTLKRWAKLCFFIETAMDLSVNAQLNQNSDYVEAIRRAFAVSIIGFVKPWLWLISLYM